MELIKRKIILNGLTISGNTIFPPNFIQPDLKIGIFLKQSYDNIGLYTDITEEINKEIFGNCNQLAKGDGQIFSDIGMYLGVFGNFFIRIEDNSVLFPEIQIGTELNISFGNIIDTVIVQMIMPKPNPNFDKTVYKINKSIPGLNFADIVNITTGQITDVILSEYSGTDNSGSGIIITTGISQNFQLSDFITNQNYVITGETDSKLNEVKRFQLLDPFIVNKPEPGNKWVRFSGTDINTNRGFIDYTLTPIDYKTFIDNNETNFKIPSDFLPPNITVFSGWNIYNTTLLPAIKEEIKMGLVQLPKIDSDIFIDRNELSVFENHYRLAEIMGVGHLIKYQRKYFIISEQ